MTENGVKTVHVLDNVESRVDVGGHKQNVVHFLGRQVSVDLVQVCHQHLRIAKSVDCNRHLEEEVNQNQHVEDRAVVEVLLNGDPWVHYEFQVVEQELDLIFDLHHLKRSEPLISECIFPIWPHFQPRISCS